jgi:4-hydroxy-3-polyprenylbenzoate decarboxylase
MAEAPTSIFIGITGASGAPYALRLVEVLAAHGCRLSLTISDTGLRVVRHELELRGTSREELESEFLARAHAEAACYHPDDLEAPVASGSSAPDAVVVCPCSLSTAAHIALGTTRTLIHRAGDVALKERRTLLLVPREIPLSSVHLRRLLEAAEAGALIVPPMPAFYAKPQTLADIVDFVVGKVVSLLGFEQDLFTPWGGATE